MFKLILQFIFNLFKKPLQLPHPEERENKTQTVANTDKGTVFENWLEEWGVPYKYWQYWESQIKLTVYDTWPAECLALGIKENTPAYVVEINGIRQLNVLASWLNPGVIAHEQAHNSYALLSADGKADFEMVWKSGIHNYDPLVALLMKKTQYWKTSVVEAHADVYRYLGQSMPENLKGFYPKLF
jgi:hypothetical protein